MDDERLFVAVVQTGGFSEASRLLGTTQSRVSRAVARLEARLGVTLLRRSSRSVEPTAVGRAYARGLTQISRSLEDLEAAVRDPTGHDRPLRLTGPPALTRRLLTPALLDFSRAHPGVQLTLELEAQRRSLLEDGFDVAVRFGPLPETWRRATQLVEGSYRLFAHPMWAEIDLMAHPERLDEVPCLVLRATHFRNKWPLQRDGTLEWLTVSPAHLFNDVELLIRCASQGMGATMLPDFLVREEVARGELVPLTRPGAAAKVFAVTEPQPLPLANALVGFLRAAVERGAEGIESTPSR